ncbi:hypothetical protein IVA95_04870 [Bradyrhizobium sp. 157]|uniref:hypothetical protein n=1 Tax=Bradyrhizobium sp. 157 TaxID=2782631 RepID=UPI001FFC142E|nr:hypothetical protein [Bradyrhizobium sp. 157]MCK1636929.1 hypothetical protein [Bradyrhizobium sp. 157]
MPAVVEAEAPGSAVSPERKAPRCKPETNAGIIEIEVDGVTIRAGRGADARMFAEIIKALKASL